MSTVVLLIHEHELARRFIGHVLEQQGGYIVIAASDSDDALRMLHQMEPTVVPDILVVGSRQHVAVLVSPLRRHLPDSRRLPTVVLDELSGEKIAPSLHRVSIEPRDLLLKLKAVLKPGVSALESLEQQGVRLDPTQQQAWVGHLPLNLTSLAFRLLHFLMTNPGRVYTRAHLLGTVWGDQSFVEERTVDVHVYRLRNQLARYGYGHLIEAVRGSGYRFSHAPQQKNRDREAGIRFAS